MNIREDEWKAAILRANRLGYKGKRVISIVMFEPRDATSEYIVVLRTDDGPTSATESW